MRIGFTGTRDGMSVHQALAFIDLLTRLGVSEFHHGDCRGADEEAHYLVREYFHNVKIVVHPPIKDCLRAHCSGDGYMIPADYTTRDRAIVDSTEALVATPLTDTYKRGSGTWYTMTYAQRIKRVVFALPRNAQYA